MTLLLGEAEEPPSRQTATSSKLPKHIPINVLSPGMAQLPAAALSARAERFPVGPLSRAFRKRFFPEATSTEWNYWR